MGTVPNVVAEKKMQWKIFRAADKLLCHSDYHGKQCGFSKRGCLAGEELKRIFKVWVHF